MATFKTTAIISAAAISAALTISGNPAHAEPDKVIYELQERCGKSAEAFIAKMNFEPGIHNIPGANSTEINGFENHYNPKLNKCFIFLTSQLMDSDKHPISITMHWQVYDVNDNRLVTSFICAANGDAVTNVNAPGNACALGRIASAHGITEGVGPSSGEHFDNEMRSLMER